MSNSITIEPITIPRSCGGWLAVSAPEHKIRFAVIGDSEWAARDEFLLSLERWQCALASDLCIEDIW